MNKRKEIIMDTIVVIALVVLAAMAITFIFTGCGNSDVVSEAPVEVVEEFGEVVAEEPSMGAEIAPDLASEIAETGEPRISPPVPSEVIGEEVIVIEEYTPVTPEPTATPTEAPIPEPEIPEQPSAQPAPEPTSEPTPTPTPEPKVDNDYAADWRYDEYYNATYICHYLKDIMGLNDYVTAGIIGNMMAETGGQTLNIKWNIGSSYYGICQWSTYYNPSVAGADLDGQLAYLASNIAEQMNTWGYLYMSGFDYSTFCAMQDPEAAALAFAKCYERCSSSYYSIREENSLVAYEYFFG